MIRLIFSQLYWNVWVDQIDFYQLYWNVWVDQIDFLLTSLECMGGSD